MKKNYIDINMNIDKLNFLSNTTKLLKANNIDTINKLAKIRKKNLKDMGFTNLQIKEMEVKLQLNGLDLNKNRY